MSRKGMYNTKMRIKRLNLSTQDEIGGISPITITVFNVACRIRQLNAAEQMVGGKDGVVSTHRVYCNNIDVHPSDKCIIRKKVYDVNTINPGSAKKGTLEIDVTLRT